MDSVNRNRRLRTLRIMGPVGWLIPYVLLLVLWETYLPRYYPDLAFSRLVRSMAFYYAQAEFWSSLLASFRRITCGYLLALALGIPAGILFGFVPMVEELLDPVLSVIRPMSPLAWLPLAIVWFGISEAAAMFLITYAAFFPVFLNTLLGISRGNQMLREAALCLGAKTKDLVISVALPEALPSILTGMRLGMGVAWSVIVAAELAIGFTLSSGIGYLMLSYAQLAFNLPRLIALTLAVGVVGLLIDSLLRLLADRITPWRTDVKVSG